MWEDTVMPLAVVSSNWLLAHDALAIRTSDAVRVVAVRGKAALGAGES